jgi:hypothetical protein
MHRSGPWGIAVLSLVLSTSAMAQGVVWDAPNVIVPKPKFGSAPDVKAGRDVWPRLDRGAVLCKTEADLLRLAASRRGEQTEPPNCQVIRAATPIQIVRRVGPGRTEVSVTDDNPQDGWTDAWLPEKSPIIGGKGMTIR